MRYPKRVGEFRSGLEQKVALQLETLGVPFSYEPKDMKVNYTSPEKAHKYQPDFVLDNGIIVETKGRFTLADRTKHLLIKSQAPDLDIRFVFSNPSAKIASNSKTSYADWCDKHGFKYAQGLIPQEWLSEYRS